MSIFSYWRIATEGVPDRKRAPSAKFLTPTLRWQMLRNRRRMASRRACNHLPGSFLIPGTDEHLDGKNAGEASLVLAIQATADAVGRQSVFHEFGFSQVRRAIHGDWFIGVRGAYRGIASAFFRFEFEFEVKKLEQVFETHDAQQLIARGDK